MKPIRIILLIVSLISLFVSIQKCNKSRDTSWTTENQLLFRDKLYEIADKNLLAENEKQMYAECGLEKAKELMPYGLGDVKDDSAKKIALQISQSCMQQIHRYIGWTNREQQDLYHIIYTVADSVNTLNDVQKKAFTDCVVQKVKIEYPSGITSIPQEVLNKKIREASLLCMKEIRPKTNFWSVNNTKLIKEKLLQSPAWKGLDDTSKNYICNCYISALKDQYPNGITGPLPAGLQKKLSSNCIKKLIKEKSHSK